VLADYPCYHWAFRHDDRNASWRPLEPVGYFEDLREVLDLVEEHMEPGPLRSELMAHWYRGKLLGRVGGAGFLQREPDYNRSIYEEIRRLALERYGPEVHEHLSLNRRVRSRLLRDGTYESLHTLARLESGLRAAVSLRAIRSAEGGITLRVDGALVGESAQLEFVRDGERILWAPPDELRTPLDEEDVDATRAMRLSRIQILLRSRSEGAEYVMQGRVRRLLVPAGAALDRLRPILTAEVVVDPRTAAAGGPLPEGLWDVHAALVVGGFTGRARMKRRNAPGFLTLAVGPDGSIREHRLPPTLRRRVARRLSRVRRR
jgi:hypothetical protein